MALPGSETVVAAAEAGLGRRLPEAHRQRLIQENGGEIRAARQAWTLFPVWDATDRRTMGRTASHLVRENEDLRRDLPDLLPEGHVAIADNGGGDLLILPPASDDVLFWDHETRESTPVTVIWGQPDTRESGRGRIRRLFGGGAPSPPASNVVSGGRLRATVESGETWGDPSEDLLFELLSDIQGGEGTFIVVERLADPSGQTYAQSTPTDAGWLVEYRDGSAERHYRTDVAHMRDAHEILTAWAFDLDDWRTAYEWRRVKL